MKISFYRNLNTLETYATNKRQIKYHFSNDEDIDVFFGLNRKFEFDSRCKRPPELNGTVVASVSCNRDKDICINLYPISQDHYPHIARNEFHNEVLPSIKEWVHNQNIKPETAVVGVEQYIIDWNGKAHIFHQLTFL
ncbi:hypothetical protein ACJ2A9_06015 [Anaerobacillus sp. MEB173]|uniref:hypothetical protein n=1 Tax=Anaerobacillus sp. MEB173 TaxID=3383345 RepID=UPI003F8E1819